MGVQCSARAEEHSSMKLLSPASIVLSLSLGLEITQARLCYDCDQGSGCEGDISEDSSDLTTKCHDDENLCKLRILNDKIERGCTDFLDFPADYEAVSGDDNKRCRKTNDNSQKD